MNNKLSNLSLLAGALLICVSQANATQSYTFTDLGPGSATAINNAGQVVGFQIREFSATAIMWNGRTPTILSSGASAGASAINKAGQVAGYIGNQSVMWNGTTPTILGIGSGGAINNAGQVAGSDGSHAVVWTRTGNGITVTNLGDGQATAINDVGQVGGVSGTHGAIWTMSDHDSTVTDLGNYASPNAINNAGQVVGTSFSPDEVSGVATLWSTSGNRVTTTILGAGTATAINNAGLVVGRGEKITDFSSGHAFYLQGPNAVEDIATLWNGTTATDLNSFLDPDEINAGWTLQYASGINDSGAIVGQAMNTQTYAYDAFLLTPNVSVGAVPEPETYALMLAGLGALGFVARRRKSL